uniref:Glycoside hydrolase, catalytic domain-containing protein n=1 Tax=Tanacetum cinerariifolium TaxID=118510 RepID=A0A6L2LG90_TANCI|nr:glycoside hydrolase, catalytic domain-containing protein [Tanacetum cinerariifolium]GEV04405.1 glycoside hydrolase, catalytic domain-containing protein [Tanacetum cinerariifolium]GEV08176.1 glycoside hydrolase, catalytic domain-containing protein [Tanacetum cinerariifolium]GEX08917.1 glycoside hydrolase, catalytic domain-containing protein [Tanacetum cinerariifolium]
MSHHHTLTLLIIILMTVTSATKIGVTYIPSQSQPPPQKVIQTLHSLKITSVHLPNPEPSVIRAFFYTNITLLLTIPNHLIHSIADNTSYASLWLYAHVVPFYPRALITAISVGHDVISVRSDVINGRHDVIHNSNDVISNGNHASGDRSDVIHNGNNGLGDVINENNDSGDVMNKRNDVTINGNNVTGDVIIRAVRNVHQALIDLGIRKIKVSTTFSFVNIMMTSFPPSSAEFQEPVNGLVIKPLLRFLSDTNSSFFVTLFPYFVYKLRPEIPLGYALFQEHAFNFRDDVVTGVRYRNLFDLMVDAVIAALTVSGYENIPLVVTETGWPSLGDGEDGELETRPLFAEIYLRGLVCHLQSGIGTPLRQEGVAETYVYEVFDTNTTFGNQAGVRGGTPGLNWGFLYPNLSMKYEVNFSGANKGTLVKEVQWLLSLVIGLLI